MLGKFEMPRVRLMAEVTRASARALSSIDSMRTVLNLLTALRTSWPMVEAERWVGFNGWGG